MSPKFIPGIASQSLGNPAHHSLPSKLVLAARYGFKSIEIYHEDLVIIADSASEYNIVVPNPSTSFPNSTSTEEALLAVARYTSDLCTSLGLSVLCLQPFMHYEGLLSSSAHAQRIAKLHFWIHLAKALNTDLIQIPSNFLPESECTASRPQLVTDLREAATVGLQHSPPIRFAYEALCWATYVDTWDHAWSIVKEVDMPNFGTCLDTFNICGRVYADPTAESGLNENAEQDMAASIAKLRTELDPAKIFYVEVVDGERLDRPLNRSHEWYVEGQRSRMTWSRNARLFAFEDRGYLPVLEVLEAIVGTGWTGVVSFEMFSRTLNQSDPSVPQEHARRAQVSWTRLCRAMGWELEEEEDIRENNEMLELDAPVVSLPQQEMARL